MSFVLLMWYIDLFSYVIETLASQVVLVIKNLPANAGDIRDVGLILRLEGDIRDVRLIIRLEDPLEA